MKETFTYEVKKEVEDICLLDSTQEFLRCAFLLSGSIENPEKEYHLEILTDNYEDASLICDKLKKFEIIAKIIEKKYKFVVYIKDSESISLFLNIIGAHNCLFKFEDALVVHDINNNINRIVNCETANITRVIDTSVRQIEAIKKVGLDLLPQPLLEVAKIRLDNPELSLKEIGLRLEKPIGKSGVNHRMKKIEEMANKK